MFSDLPCQSAFKDTDNDGTNYPYTCGFPFITSGKTYSQCTYDPDYDTPWCYHPNYDPAWGFCDEGCPQEKLQCNGADECCQQYRKCGVGQGDCDGPSTGWTDCRKGLVCGDNNCGGQTGGQFKHRIFEGMGLAHSLQNNEKYFIF